MTAGAHDAGGGFGRSAGANAARGVGVIVAAVLLGILLMSQGLGESVEAASDDDTTSESTDTDATTDGDAAATEATETTDDGVATDAAGDDAAADEAVVEAPAVARPPAEVTVLVLNGTNGLQGVAGRGSAVAENAGYLTADPKNADVDGPSVILYTEGYEADAIALAGVYQVDPALTVQAFDPANSPIADTQGANVIIRVGNDGVIAV